MPQATRRAVPGPIFPSTHPAPTRGWPAKGISAAGVKMRAWGTPGLVQSRNTVSEKARSAAMACMDAGSRPVTSVTTPRGFPPTPPRVKTLST